MTADRRFVVTFFSDVYGQDLTEKEMSLDELRDLVLHTTARQKVDLPLLKLANFGTKRTAENSLRFNGNVETSPAPKPTTTTRRWLSTARSSSSVRHD